MQIPIYYLNSFKLFLASTTFKPKKFSVKPSNKTVLQNEDAILECIVTGFPKPQVEWQKDGTAITLTTNGHYSTYGASSLKVSSAQAADSGKYECVMGAEKAKAYLQVVGKNLFCTVIGTYGTLRYIISSLHSFHVYTKPMSHVECHKNKNIHFWATYACTLLF